MSEQSRCLLVVVLYGMPAEESTTVQRIAAALGSKTSSWHSYEMLLWDNSPSADAPAAGDGSASGSLQLLGLPCRYERATVNDGIAGAGNAAMRYCEQQGIKWMLMLDQDTAVTEGYLAGMLAYRQAVECNVEVAAVVPLLRDGGFQLSPKQVLPFRDRPVANLQPGVLDGEVFAANSGALLRVSALQEIGGYSLDFWLDHSDMYMFHQFYRQRLKVFFAADLVLQHRMAMLDYDGSMSPARYANFLAAEQAFLDLYKGSLENAVQGARLLLRSIRQRRRYRDKAYAAMTLRLFLDRLVSSKADRLRAWKLRAAQRRQVRVVTEQG